MFKWTFCIALFFVGQVLWAHPIKMSTGKIVLNTNDSIGELVINFFTDDFEPEIRRLYPQPPFNFEAPSQDMLASIYDYINSNVTLILDGVTAKISFTQIKKIEENVCQVRLNVAKNGSCKSIKIRNTLLFSSFEKQSNILHLVVDKEPPRIVQFYPNHPLVEIQR